MDFVNSHRENDDVFSEITAVLDIDPNDLMFVQDGGEHNFYYLDAPILELIFALEK